MVEIHAQKRPGRPVLLNLLSAGLLVVTLVIAWAQTTAHRRLGPPVPVANTPLSLRLPAGWVQLDDDPPVFGQLAGRRRKVALRELTVRYGQRETFLDPGRLRPEGEFRRTRIGPLPAIEFATRQVVQFGRRRIVQQTLVRMACSPRGDWLHFEYVPLESIRPAEVRLFDAICNAVQIEGLTSLDERQIARRCGVHFERSAAVRVVAAGRPAVRGVWVTGWPDDRPAWVIGVFRTFLVPFRGSDDLLRGLAAEHWGLDEQQVQVPASPATSTAAAIEAPIQVRRREDGAFVLRVENPRLDENPSEDLASAWVVEKAPDQVAMLLVFAGPQGAVGAEPVVERIAESLRFEDRWPDVDAALAQGRELAAMLTRRGALPWWGRLPPQLQYAGPTLDGPAAIAITRRLRDEDPAEGYTGCMSLLIRSDDARGPLDRFGVQRWQIDGHAQGYTLEVAFGTARAGRPAFHHRVREWRDAPDGPLQRTIHESDDTTREQHYPLSEAFVAPPVESIAEWLVAKGTLGPAVIENSPVLNGPPHWSFLAAAGTGPGGSPRLVRIDDDWPLGETRVLSEPGIADTLRLATGRLRRVDDATRSGFARLLRAARRLCAVR